MTREPPSSLPCCTGGRTRFERSFRQHAAVGGGDAPSRRRRHARGRARFRRAQVKVQRDAARTVDAAARPIAARRRVHHVHRARAGRPHHLLSAAEHALELANLESATAIFIPGVEERSGSLPSWEAHQPDAGHKLLTRHLAVAVHVPCRAARGAEAAVDRAPSVAIRPGSRTGLAAGARDCGPSRGHRLWPTGGGG